MNLADGNSVRRIIEKLDFFLTPSVQFCCRRKKKKSNCRNNDVTQYANRVPPPVAMAARATTQKVDMEGRPIWYITWTLLTTGREMPCIR